MIPLAGALPIILEIAQAVSGWVAQHNDGAGRSDGEFLHGVLDDYALADGVEQRINQRAQIDDLPLADGRTVKTAIAELRAVLNKPAQA